MSKTLSDFLVGWGPVIILVIVWFYFMKRRGIIGQSTTGNSDKFIKELLTEIREMNEKLDRIVSLLEKQNRLK